MENKKKLVCGITGEKEVVVTGKHLARSVGSGMVNVYSTAMMIAGMESVCVESVEPYMEKGMTTVGVEVHVFHDSPTPEGMKAFFKSELVEISPNGRGLLFKVQATDEKDVIGHGLIRRVIVNREKFETRAQGKCAQEAGTA